MQITFHGVRGSLPSPGPETASFGGNTSCVHVRLACGTHLIFDAGTGIRRLGNQLVEHSDPLHLLLTHSHWDHIQGFPFFAPCTSRTGRSTSAGAFP
ncbi:MAG: MBL fold metallo-hydrolase [Gammaproteobacteria bacterium]|nr:MBL fold metallo-hydrolase [Gammaproteobacteria bacterium]